MRVLLKADSDPEQQKKDKVAFLTAYDKGYIWASEPVIVAIRVLIQILEAKAAIEGQLKGSSGARASLVITESQRLDTEARRLYQSCMLEMRKDSGCPESGTEYRVISFE